MTEEVSSQSSSDEKDPLSGLESFVASRINKSPTTTTVSFDELLEPPLLLHEDLKEGCGGQLWPAGMVLAKYMLRHHFHDIADKTILELGAGGGLVGLALARGCKTNKPIIITDQLPMLSLMQQNIALNSLDTEVIAGVLDWGTSISAAIEKHFSKPTFPLGEQYPDVVLAADCVYFEPAFPLLLQSMHQLLGPETVCCFCFKKRRKADWRFIKEMKKQFEVADIAYDDRNQDVREGIYLYEVRRSPKKN